LIRLRQDFLYFYANLMPLFGFQLQKIYNGTFIIITNNYYSFTAFSTKISLSGPVFQLSFCARRFSTAILGR
jgi:hypothetical protein